MKLALGDARCCLLLQKPTPGSLGKRHPQLDGLHFLAAAWENSCRHEEAVLGRSSQRKTAATPSEIIEKGVSGK
eukprot:s4554_g4.t1